MKKKQTYMYTPLLYHAVNISKINCWCFAWTMNWTWPEVELRVSLPHVTEALFLRERENTSERVEFWLQSLMCLSFNNFQPQFKVSLRSHPQSPLSTRSEIELNVNVAQWLQGDAPGLFCFLLCFVRWWLSDGCYRSEFAQCSTLAGSGR